MEAAHPRAPYYSTRQGVSGAGGRVVIRSACVVLLMTAVAVGTPPAMAADERSDTGLRSITVELPHVGRRATLHVYRPPPQDGEAASCLPVVYMPDGHSLFEPARLEPRNPLINDQLERERLDALGWYGSWRLGERLDAAIRAGESPPVMIVGIAARGGERTMELSPWPWYGAPDPAGDALAQDLVKTVKPLIDRRFPTCPGRHHTAVAGSSLGGVFALYAAFRDPAVFGAVAALSPALSRHVLGRELTAFVAATRPPPMRVHVDLGTRERVFGPLGPLRAALRRAGVSESRLRVQSVPGGRHRVEDWGARFPQVVGWLFPGVPPRH